MHSTGCEQASSDHSLTYACSSDFFELHLNDETEVTERNDDGPRIDPSPTRGLVKNAFNDGTDAPALVGFDNVYFQEAETRTQCPIAEVAG